jgi:mRNA interferase RelE/StbE
MGQKKWSIKFSPEFEKEWDKTDPSIQKKVIHFFTERLQREEHPKYFAKPLSGNLKNFWRFRIGDYRVICNLLEEERIIYLLRIAHRREVYD